MREHEEQQHQRHHPDERMVNVINVYSHDERIRAQLDRIERLIIRINNQGTQMANLLQDLQVELDAEVTRNTTVDESVKVALKFLFDKFNAVIESAKLEPATLASMRASIATLRGSSDSVVASVIANTVAEHAPDEPPVPAEE